MMTQQRRAEIIGSILCKLFPNPSISLNYTNTYTLLIAVLLSAQCTDARVNRVTPHLFSLADTAQKMSFLSPEEIEIIIRPCGLAPKKSRAIYELSKQLLFDHGGEVPPSLAALEKLPGVGHKTASVVVSQAFHQSAFPVDTHIFRCARRWGLTDNKTVRGVELDLKKLFPENSWRQMHMRIIYYARQFCPARGHREERCPICALSWTSEKPACLEAESLAALLK